jgi:DNA-binding transcriptional LysR family regulator
MSIPPPLRKLQYVLAVARELHFRRAAERLNVSQPYISRQIKEFEADIGFNIFRRDPVCLTASGQELVVRISEMLSRLDADFRIAVDAARAVNQRQA